MDRGEEEVASVLGGKIREQGVSIARAMCYPIVFAMLSPTASAPQNAILITIDT